MLNHKYLVLNKRLIRNIYINNEFKYFNALAVVYII
jgi:hypothetical protein